MPWTKAESRLGLCPCFIYGPALRLPFLQWGDARTSCLAPEAYAIPVTYAKRDIEHKISCRVWWQRPRTVEESRLCERELD